MVFSFLFLGDKDSFDIVFLLDFFNFGQSGVLGKSDRVFDNMGFSAFDSGNLICLFLDTHESSLFQIYLWIIPSPPFLAISTAISYSVTVSILIIENIIIGLRRRNYWYFKRHVSRKLAGNIYLGPGFNFAVLGN